MIHYNPRAPDPHQMVGTDSTHPAHANLRKTLVLLKITTPAKPIYFVIEGLAIWPETIEELCSHEQYFYEEHTCPTNFIRIPLIAQGGDLDPHGVFEFVDAVWMTNEYLGYVESGEENEYLIEVFPVLMETEAPED